MQSWNSPRENALYNVHPVLKQLADRNIDLPDTVTAAAATLARIENSRPAEPPTDAIRRAILDAADQDTLDRLVLAELGHSRLAAEHRQAILDAAVAVMSAIRAEHDTIFAQLAALAHKQIEHLEAVAQLPTTDVMQLVRDGNHKGAQLVAGTDAAATELEVLYDLRDDFLSGGFDKMTLGHVDCSRWRDPDKPGRGATPAERCLDGLIEQENELWFPTRDQALDAARPIFERDKAKADENAAVRRTQNAAAQAFAR
ncbi:hypothetical protein [Mycobacterium celatum]|uniref:hypothetical protein n=1 Tax=Mycobacterium celatum TaxID=28045 RepID=UPI000A65A4E0|nr:hypothetical protein [Mycobacterium celatum]